MIFKQSFYVPATITTMTVAGFVVGYKVAERRLAAEFETRLEKETEGMREFYQNTKQPYPTPQEAAAALVPDEVREADKTSYHKIIKQENYQPSDDGANTAVDFPEQPLVFRNIFSKNERDPEFPYLLSQEEFMLGEREWEQATLTFYRKDGVLVDEREERIGDIEKVIGVDALNNFGFQASDQGVVHVRNEKLGMDFEVVLHEGSYSVEVLGLEGPLPDLPSGRPRSD